MNYEQHIAAAESLAREEERLSNDGGAGMLSAEAIWGATVQVINAINHARDRRAHANNNRDRRVVIDYLEARYQDLVIEDGFETALRRLHNHFYGGHLSETELAAYLDTGRGFIAAMIELAALEAAETERAEQESVEPNAAPPI